jgi:hypothetical protein
MHDRAFSILPESAFLFAKFDAQGRRKEPESAFLITSSL